MTKTILFTVLAVFFATHSLLAQPEVNIYDVTTSPGEVLVQVDMLNFTGSNTFSAFTFEISFDDDLLVFTGIQNTSISGTWLSNHNEGGTSPLIVSFTSFGTAQNLNGKLLDLRFTYYGGFSSPIDFVTQFCEVAKGNLELIPNVIYNNGSISQTPAVGDVSMINLESPAGTVLMPVTMGGDGFKNITQLKYRIAYDTDRLTYQSIQNSLLPGFTASTADGILTFEWSGSEQDFITATKIFDLDFTFDGLGNASLEFLPGSFVKSLDDYLATDYVDGFIESSIRNWTGALDSDWHNPGNWSGNVPGSDDEVVIAPSANNPEINGSAFAGSLFLEAGASLTIAPSGSLSVTGSLLNDAGTANLLVRSDDTGTGSLMYGSGTVNATVQRHIPNNAGMWRQISSPVAAQDIESDFGSGSFFSWFEPVQTWVSLKNNLVWPTWNDVNDAHKNFIPAKGYLAAHSNALIPQVRTLSNLVFGSGIIRSYTADETITVAGDGTNVQVLGAGGLSLLAGQSIHLMHGFSVQAGGEFHASIDPDGNYFSLPEFAGTLNHGPQNFTLQRKSHLNDPKRGFNLVGNPYPSSIDWKAPDGWSGRNNLLMEGGGYNIWIWNGITGNYGAYNSASLGDEGTNGVSRYITPMQGFWVEAINDEGVLGMNNTVRTHSSQEWLKQTLALADILKLKVSSTANQFSDEVKIEFGHESDGGGTPKFYGMESKAPSVYAIKEGNNFTISFLTDISEHPAVTLGFEAGVEAIYTLALASPGFFHEIIVEDLRDQRMQKLSLENPYHFSARSSDDPERFVLHFKALGTDPVDMLPAMQSWAYNNMLYVSNPFEETAVAEIFNAAGSLLKTREINSAGLHRLPLGLPPGIYLLKLQNNHAATSSKLLVF